MNGELDFKAALRERVAMLAGLPLDALQRTWERVELTDGARDLVATMRANGAYAALVSGGFTFFTSRVAALCGFHEHRSNTLLDDGAALIGRVAEPILDRDSKRATLTRLATEQGLALADTLAVGDGANDLDMLHSAGLGVAFHAKPIVAAARVHAWIMLACAPFCSHRATGPGRSSPTDPAGTRLRKVSPLLGKWRPRPATGLRWRCPPATVRPGEWRPTRFRGPLAAKAPAPTDDPARIQHRNGSRWRPQRGRILLIERGAKHARIVHQPECLQRGLAWPGMAYHERHQSNGLRVRQHRSNISDCLTPCLDRRLVP